ncbi:hypothetical protein F9U64_10815 [Gracilibacillus oryzae]|uniref:Uncharacterized protein n=1 Tax=Gracilibacillus oryzae TaxID=1672701 RepID=A0A7C8KV13_9BACI|nr:hypothetical protein [Gracilibacillus oryzae]KAB8135755.1 hypothetical protein F9U64_10815 [Gracilibacillus oryzae]
MIKSKVFFISSLTIFLICMCLYFPFPNNTISKATASFMTFPVSNQEGVVILGLIGSILFFIALNLLWRSLNKFRFPALIAAVLIYTFLPSFLIDLYQGTIANGIYAVAYDGDGTCRFDNVSEETADMECDLLLHNRSDETISFHLGIIDSSISYREENIDSPLKNLNESPYQITIEANQKKSVHLQELLDISGLSIGFDGAEWNYINLKLIDDGNNSRIL